MTKEELAQKLKVEKVETRTSDSGRLEIVVGEFRVGSGMTEDEAIEDAARCGARNLAKAKFRAEGLQGQALIEAVDKSLREA